MGTCEASGTLSGMAVLLVQGLCDETHTLCVHTRFTNVGNTGGVEQLQQRQEQTGRDGNVRVALNRWCIVPICAICAQRLPPITPTFHAPRCLLKQVCSTATSCPKPGCWGWKTVRGGCLETRGGQGAGGRTACQETGCDRMVKMVRATASRTHSASHLASRAANCSCDEAPLSYVHPGANKPTDSPASRMACERDTCTRALPEVRLCQLIKHSRHPSQSTTQRACHQSDLERSARVPLTTAIAPAPEHIYTLIHIQASVHLVCLRTACRSRDGCVDRAEGSSGWDGGRVTIMYHRVSVLNHLRSAVCCSHSSPCWHVDGPVVVQENAICGGNSSKGTMPCTCVVVSEAARPVMMKATTHHMPSHHMHPRRLGSCHRAGFASSSCL